MDIFHDQRKIPGHPMNQGWISHGKPGVFNIFFEYYYCLKMNYFIFGVKKQKHFHYFVSENNYFYSQRKKVSTKT